MNQRHVNYYQFILINSGGICICLVYPSKLYEFSRSHLLSLSPTRVKILPRD